MMMMKMMKVRVGSSEKFIVAKGGGFFLSRNALQASVPFSFQARRESAGDDGDIVTDSLAIFRGRRGGGVVHAPAVVVVMILPSMTGAEAAAVLFALAHARPSHQHRFERLAADGFGQVVVHAGLAALFAIALDGGGGHGDDGEGSDGGVGRVRVVVADHVGRAVAVEDGHLDVHEDDVWVAVVGIGVGGVGGGGGFYEVVERFFTVPDRVDGEAEFSDRLQGYLLVDLAVFCKISFSVCL